MDESLILNYFPDLTPSQIDQLAALKELYTYWNERINVISRKDIQYLYERHVLHSLAIARFLQFPENTKVLDIGTGGGFPGIPLAIFFPQTTFILVDSIAKKIKVVQEVAKAIHLENVDARHLRVERIKDRVDFVVSRAVARSRQLVQWTNQLIVPSSHPTRANGYLLLKGGELDEELKEVRRPYELVELSTFFSEPFFETKKLIYIPV